MNNGYKKISGYHPITMRMISVLEAGTPGDTHSDAELAEFAGIPVGVGESGYGYLQSAIRYCEQKGVVWQRVKNEHYIVCLKPEEIIVRSECDLRAIRKRTRRSSVRMSFVKPDDLPQGKRQEAMALSSQLGAIALMAKMESTRKLVSKSVNSVPQIADAMALLSK